MTKSNRQTFNNIPYDIQTAFMTLCDSDVKWCASSLSLALRNCRVKTRIHLTKNNIVTDKHVAKELGQRKT